MNQETCTTDGKPFDPTIGDTGQQKNYKVLCEEERAKGFVRPLRRSYKHVGRKLRGELEMLPEPKEISGKIYAAIDRFKVGETTAGSYLTQDEVDQIKRSGFYGGCGAVTSMGLALCETYARDPKFYGATFCSGCGTHLPVGEFRWEEDGEVVGS